jgi:undecaprenyl pyrophosphate phosphatase UppP
MDWKKFFSDPTTVVAMFTSGVAGLLIGIINGVVQKRHGGWSAFCAAIATGTGVAIIVGLALHEYVKSETLKLAIIGFCAVISDDIWAGFKTLGTGFRNNPLDSVSRVLDALRGRSSLPTPPVAPKEE